MAVNPAELERLEKLPDAWTSFQSALSEAEATLDASKEVSAKLIRMVDKLIVDAEEHGAAFAAKSPKNVEDAAPAHASLDAAREFLARRSPPTRRSAGAREGSRLGMEIFGVPHPPLRELALVEREMEHLTKLWGLVAEWLGVRRVVAGQISGFGD